VGLQKRKKTDMLFWMSSAFSVEEPGKSLDPWAPERYLDVPSMRKEK